MAKDIKDFFKEIDNIDNKINSLIIEKMDINRRILDLEEKKYHYTLLNNFKKVRQINYGIDKCYKAIDIIDMKIKNLEIRKNELLIQIPTQTKSK